jgi:hypothetical protein
MMVPYVLRLLCICLAAFFLINVVLSLFVSFALRAAIRISGRLRARSAARFLFLFRMLPAALGLVAVLALCIPSYLWLEPQGVLERVGWVGLGLATVGGAIFAASFTRGAYASIVALRSNRIWQQTGRPAQLPGGHSNAVIVEEQAPLLALAGVFRPRLFISGGVLRALTPEELEVALKHENAHRLSLDNLKRLLLVLAPNAVPFLSGWDLLEQNWARLSEWAADDEAVEGDRNRALSLARALVRVARLGAGAQLSFLHTSLAAGEDNLSLRVERLLRLEPCGTEPLRRSRYWAVALGGCFCFAVCGLALVLGGPATLSSVHRLLELFLR